MNEQERKAAQEYRANNPRMASILEMVANLTTLWVRVAVIVCMFQMVRYAWQYNAQMLAAWGALYLAMEIPGRLRFIGHMLTLIARGIDRGNMHGLSITVKSDTDDEVTDVRLN